MRHSAKPAIRSERITRLTDKHSRMESQQLIALFLVGLMVFSMIAYASLLF